MSLFSVFLEDFVSAVWRRFISMPVLGFTPDSVALMKRRELQDLAKEHNIKANTKVGQNLSSSPSLPLSLAVSVWKL
jgi:hypothetical protein